MISNNLFGGLSHQEFLDEYWQQKPLLVRQAFAGITPPFSAEDLAGLCCDTEAPSRIIIEKGDTPWQVINAPLEEEHFLNTPDTHWTLLVNDLEQYYPDLLTLIDNFRFIPDWRIDDLMVSYAPEGGSVGPHVDQYDVFLIQASGKRHWQLDPGADTSKYLTNIELNILAEFNTVQEWTLEPGDMLYLPPNLAHYGVARGGDCMTYSVGFRSPSQQELLESWIDKLIEKEKLGARYHDARRPVQSNPGQLDLNDIAALKAHMLKALKSDDEEFTHWLGSYLTTPKNPDQETFIIDDHLSPDIAFFRNPDSRLAWVEQQDHITFFVNGEASDWPIASKNGIQYICDSYQYPSVSLEKNLLNEDFRQLFENLVEKEIVHFSSRCKD